MRRVLPLLAVSCLAFAPAPFLKVSRGKDDLRLMQGQWRLSKVIEEGRELTAGALRQGGMDLTVEVAGDQWTHVTHDTRNKEEERVTYTIRKLDQKKLPKRIVLAGEHEDVAFTYLLEGDTLTIQHGGEGEETTVFERNKQ